MNIPSNLKYTKSHEWVRVEADGSLTVAINALQSMSSPHRFLGTAPPHRPTSTKILPDATARFTASASLSTVGGIEFRGMSTMVPMPP